MRRHLDGIESRLVQWVGPFAATRKMLIGFRKDETGHLRAIENKLEKIRTNKLNVGFYCPRCGWVLVYGCNPEVGQVIKCPACHVPIQLIINEDGEYAVEEHY